MERVAFEDVEPERPGSGVERRGLSDPLGTTNLAVNRYRLAPGEGFPGGLHAHADQEEVFVVVEGEATFETYAPRGDGNRPDRGDEVTVAAGEAIRFAPGEFQSGRNDADGDLVAFAMGAPRDTGDVRLPLEYPDCGRADVRLATDEGGPTFVCPDCDAERVPRACPACGHDDMRVVLGEEARPVVACRGCDAEFEDPPVRGDGEGCGATPAGG